MVIRWVAGALVASLAIIGGLFVHPQTEVSAKMFTLFYGARYGLSLGILSPPDFLVNDESFHNYSPELVAWQYLHSHVMRAGSDRLKTHEDLARGGLLKSPRDGQSQPQGSLVTEHALPYTVRASTVEIPSRIDDHRIESDVFLPEGVNELKDALGAIITLHGGAHVRGTRYSQFGQAAYLTNATGFAALNLRIRLLPNNTVDQHIGDVVSAVHFLRDQGIPTANVVLSGCSAGAGLATLAALELLESGHRVGALILNSPGDFHYIDANDMFPSHDENRNTSMLSTSMLTLVASLLGEETIERIRLLDRDYTGFPPVNLVLGEYDMIRDHGRELGKRMNEKFDVDVVVNVVDGGYHCPYSGSGFVPEARRELSRGAEWILQKVPRKA